MPVVVILAPVSYLLTCCLWCMHSCTLLIWLHVSFPQDHMEYLGTHSQPASHRYNTSGSSNVSIHPSLMKQILTFVVSTYGARHLWGPNFLRCLTQSLESQIISLLKCNIGDDKFCFRFGVSCLVKGLFFKVHTWTEINGRKLDLWWHNLIEL